MTINSSDNFLPEFKASAISEDVVALDICVLGDTSYVAQGYDYSVLAATYTPEQIDDFRLSAIDPDLVLLNCRRLHRQDEMIYALRKIEPRHRTANGQGLLAQYIKRQPVEWSEGGVGFWGYAETQTAVQVKPDSPRQDNRGRKIKYESPSGLAPQLIIPRVTPQIWQRISERVNVPIGIYTDYRKWIIDHPHIWMGLGEGYKKVLSVVSAGYPAIGFTGIENWSMPRECEWDLREPISELKLFLTSGRHFVNLYDCDQNSNTVAKVNKAIGTSSKVLLNHGCTVNRATWDNNYKGIDDLIFNCGVESISRVISNSKPITLVSIDSGAKKPPENMIADTITKQFKERLIYCSESKEWYWYEKTGKWVVRNNDEIDAFFRHEIEKEVPNYGTTNYVNNVINAAKSRLMKIKWCEASGTEYTPFQNGVLNLKTFELEPYKPDFYFRWQLPYDYNSSAECELVKQWLLETMKGDPVKVQIIRAYLRAILTGRNNMERYLELVGVGGSGKSTIINIAMALVGRENCHITDLSMMETDKYEMANYQNKKLVIISDSDDYGGDVKKLKQLVGNDHMRAERKYHDATITKPIGLVIVAANEAIQSKDYTSGLHRRRLSMPMLNIVRIEKRRELLQFQGDGSLLGEFAPLVAGIYNWVMALSDRDVTNLIVKTEKYAPSMKSWANEILIQTNPLAAWLDDNIVIAPGVRTQVGHAKEIRLSFRDENLSTSHTEFENADKWLYANYRAWSASNGSSKPIASKRFRALLIDLTSAQLRIDVTDGNDRQGAYIIGLAIRSSGDEISPSPVMGRDGSVMVETSSGDGCDGCDRFSINSSLDIDVVAPQQHHEPYAKLWKLNEEKGQNGCNPSPVDTPAITDPSQTYHDPSHPSPEPVSAAAEPATIAQNPLETSSSDSDVDTISYLLDRKVKIGSKVQRNSVERPGQSSITEILGCEVVDFRRGDWKVAGLDGSTYNVPPHKFQCGEWSVSE